MVKSKIKVEDILQHAENRRIYSATNIEQLMECIKSLGLMQRIILNKKNEVLCGYRRFLAIKELGWKEVEVEIVDIPIEEEPAYMVSSNSHRTKTSLEKYHEIKILKSYWGKKQGQRTDLEDCLSEEEKLTTRKRIANEIGVTESEVRKTEYVGDKAFNLLPLIGTGEDKISLNEAYKACAPQKPQNYKAVEEVDLLEIKLCHFCGNETKRINTNENGELIYENHGK